MNDSYGDYSLPGSVRFVRTLPGPIERVWQYLTDPEKRRLWLASGPMELHSGGRLELQFRHTELSPGEQAPPKYEDVGQGHTLTGTILRCEPPHVLCFTWEGDGEPSEVSFELKEEGPGVLLVLNHRKLTNREQTESVSGGWHVHLAILIARLEGKPIPRFWETHSVLEAEYGRRLDALAGAQA